MSPEVRPLKKVLVANRGEIAVRIIRACRTHGVECAVVYSDADRTTRAVRLANEAVRIGPPEARLSYLDPERILDAARQVGADAIHPGYGFLAESAEFARSVREAGFVFVGPSADAIDAMGDKINARRRMKEAGVPVVPGKEAEAFDRDSLAEAAESIGYPVMLKATAGGGGKGIRIVWEESELWSAYEQSVGEAEKAFGNGTVYMEKALEEPHHVEFQIFGDRHGHVVHLFDRECSVQRRHQKVVEESPSPFLTPALRAEMAEAAVAAAKAMDYDNAGTVEFLVDKHRNFYFLEMNTRLQVEHPVTEMVLGVDLVAEQLRVAAGEPMSFDQTDLVPHGHAIEVRVCAEDPDRNYMPAVGTVQALTVPAGPGVRVDSGLAPGLEVTLHYDSMLAKLICWGTDRDQALGRLKQALSEFKVAGLKTNIPFLGAILRDERFAKGHYDTGFLSDFQPPEMREDLLRAALVAAVLTRHGGALGATARAASDPSCGMDPWKALGRWKRLGRP